MGMTNNKYHIEHCDREQTHKNKPGTILDQRILSVGSLFELVLMLETAKSHTGARLPIFVQL